ncbi:hypothetical protein GA0074692_5359 [Micromonospora pallida]|uniref:Uncharacterized protein n=1 Tax=Micromonospora pallida TaxID=145854 RepID=A0A1C6TC82_9ACTN|nr:hypothetical protein [Micromonospora pallida]SCL39426.1 hypothetical protein GA0074692_5359 [Micromonospora pallida]
MSPLRAGDLLHITRAASVQFVTPIAFRLIRVLDLPTFDGWLWLDGYQVDKKGDAVARREIFVQRAGLRKLPPSIPAPWPVSRGRPSRTGGGTAAGLS